MRYETSMTVKGQITVPKDIRDALGLKPGQKVGLQLGPDGEVRLLKPDVMAERENRIVDFRKRVAQARKKYGGEGRFQGLDGLDYQRWLRPDSIDP